MTQVKYETANYQRAVALLGEGEWLEKLRYALAAYIHGDTCTCPYSIEEFDLQLADEALAGLHGYRHEVGA